MKKFSKLFAALLTVCLLCGIVATFVSAADGVAGNVTNYVTVDFESDTANSELNQANKKMTVNRFTGNLPKIVQDSETGNKYMLVTSPSEENSLFKVDSNRTAYPGINGYSTYLQFAYTNYDAKPSENFFGTYNGQTNPYSYLVYDLDFAAMGYEITYTDGTVAGATQVVKNSDGSVTATLTDGSTVTTSADGKTTTVRNGGTVTVTVTSDTGTVITQTDSDGKITRTETVTNAEGTVTKTVSTGTEIDSLKVTETATRQTNADGSYTITVTDAQNNTKTAKYELSGKKNSAGTYTETLTVTEGDTTTVYKTECTVKSVTGGLWTTNMTQTVTVGTATYKNNYDITTVTSASNVQYENYDAEFAAYFAIDDTDISGAHIKSYRLAYSDDLRLIFDGIRYWVNNSWSSGAQGYRFRYVDGEWYACMNDGTICTDTNGVKIKLESEVGKWNHFTAVATSSGISFFINGTYTHFYKYTSDTVWLESLRLTDYDILPGNYHCYAFDNITERCYTSDYSSGKDVYGIDDYMSNSAYLTENLSKCEDIVYHNYKSLNGYVMVDDGIASDNETAIAKLLATVKNGSVIESTLDITDFTVPDGVKRFKVILPYGNKFTLAETSRSKFVVAPEGDGVYTVRPAEKSDMVTVHWVFKDSVTGEETVIKKEQIPFGTVPEFSTFITSSFDETKSNYTMSIRSYSDWMFDIDGDYPEVNLYDPEPARALEKLEVQLIQEEFGGILAITTSTVESTDYVMTDYVIGYFDVENNFIAYPDSADGYEKYSDIATLPSEITSAPDGATVILMYDEDYTLFGSNTIALPADKTINFDMNGRTLISTNNTNYPTTGVFMINERTTFNLYSSVAGAKLFEASKQEPTDWTNSYAKLVFGTGGIIAVKGGVNSCVTNIDGKNITFTGGTIFKVNSGNSESDEEKITLNINGGTFYSPERSSYAMFVTNKDVKDVVINVENADFYVNCNQYSIIHNYENSAMDFIAKNSNFLCNADKNTRFIYTLNEDSNVYLEDCKIVGDFVSAINRLNGKVVFGKGNDLACNDIFSCLDTGAISFADGVLFLKNTTDALVATVSVSHPDYKGVYAEDENDRDIVIGSDSATLVAGRYENMTVTERTGKVAIQTFAEDAVPEYAVKVEWLTLDKTAVLATEYATASTTLTDYTTEGLPTWDVGSKWYACSYATWDNVTDGAENTDRTVIGGKVNQFIPSTRVCRLVADIKPLVNMTFYSHFSLNIHLVTEDGISGIGFFEKLTSTSAITDDVNTGNIIYNGTSLSTYYNTVYPTVEVYDSYTRVIRFTVAEYDLNGDGNITDDEKNISLYQELSFNDVEYATRVVEKFGCGSQEAKLMYDFVSYKYGVYSAMQTPTETAQAVVGKFFEAFDSHGEDCTCKTDLTKISDLYSDDEKALIEKGASAYSGLTSASTAPVTGLAFSLDITKPGLAIYVNANTAKFTKYNYVKATFTGADGTKTTYTLTIQSGNYTVNGKSSFLYVAQSIPADAINSVIDIEISYSYKPTTSGRPMPKNVKGEYCLASYIEAMQNESSVDLAKLFYAYSNSCKEYYNYSLEKYGTGTVSPSVDY